MNIKRYEHMPFYLYPAAKSWISWEDTVITFLDWLVDAHEHERNNADNNRSFYQRSLYVYENFLRYQNDTMGNLMYDTQLKKFEYDILNATVSRAN
jgi:ABC-type transport system involved in Fe-S cluster assembly fused permease/ATPase subunit